MKLSRHQEAVLRHLRVNGGELRRIPGGFWVTPNAILRAGNVPAAGEFYTEIRTVRCLEQAGHLERTNAFSEEWRDTRKLIT
jgi:hypothetical protein